MQACIGQLFRSSRAIHLLFLIGQESLICYVPALSSPLANPQKAPHMEADCNDQNDFSYRMVREGDDPGEE